MNNDALKISNLYDLNETMNMRSVGRIYGFTEVPMYFHQLILQDQQLSVKMQR